MATDRTVPLGPGAASKASVSLRVTEAGDGGRPLLLVHGFGGARGDFANFLDPLAARGWHAVAPDLRGHGESDKPADEAEYSFDIFADDLSALTDTLGWDRFALLGHSMGGMIAQVLALRAPERLPVLVLMDTGHGHFDLDPDLAALGAKLAREEGMDVLADIQKTIDDPLATRAYLRMVEEDPSYAERGDRNLRAVAPAMYASMLQQIVTSASRLEQLSALVMPTLVIVGEQDDPFYDASHDIAAALPDSRLAVIPDGGHSPQFESPDRWWEALSTFLDDFASLVPLPEEHATT